MAIGTDLQQFVEAGWGWIQRDINTWVRAMGDLTSVLKEHDLESEDTLKFALRFSAFSIIIAMLVDYPAKQLILGQQFSSAIYISVFILYYVMTFVYAVSSRLVGFAIVTRRRMRVYLIIALFSTVYWPINNLGDYLLWGDKKLAYQLSLPTFDSLFIKDPTKIDPSSTNFDPLYLSYLMSVYVVSVVIVTYVFTRLMPSCRYVFGIGRIRASLLVIGTAIVASVVQSTLMRPVFEFPP